MVRKLIFDAEVVKAKFAVIATWPGAQRRIAEY
jgi:hypothetical protein